MNEGKFELAKAKLREITPESPYYPQAVWLIQKVPFKKGIDAYEKQQFEHEELSVAPAVPETATVSESPKFHLNPPFSREHQDGLPSRFKSWVGLCHPVSLAII